MRFRIYLVLGLLSLASCSPASKDPQPMSKDETAESASSVNGSTPSGGKYMLVGDDREGHKYYAPIPNGLDQSALHEGEELSAQDEKTATDFMLGPDIQKGCCRVRVRWRVVVKKPSVTVRGGGVTVGSPSVTVGNPTVTTSGWPEIRWNARSLIPSNDPPEFYDITTQCVDQGKGSTVFVVNNEDKAVSVRIQVEGTDYDIALKKRERRSVSSWADLPCSITQARVIVYGEQKS